MNTNDEKYLKCFYANSSPTLKNNSTHDLLKFNTDSVFTFHCENLPFWLNYDWANGPEIYLSNFRRLKLELPLRYLYKIFKTLLLSIGIRMDQNQVVYCHFNHFINLFEIKIIYEFSSILSAAICSFGGCSSPLWLYRQIRC